VVGVVKSVDTQYYDEADLPDLPQGWRSAVLRLHADRRGGRDRWTTYVRLQDVSRHDPWQLGLIRVEAFAPELLDPAAAWCLRVRQRPPSPDPRWDRHLGPVAATERALRARSCPVFDM
jgi:hypothetical protein